MIAHCHERLPKETQEHRLIQQSVKDVLKKQYSQRI